MMLPVLLAAITDGITPSGVEFAAWLGCAYLALKLWNEGQIALGRNKTPQPLRVTGEIRYATHEELEQLRGEFRRLQASLEKDFGKLEDKISDADRAAEERAVEIHKRINEIINHMPQQIITLLRETGALSSPKK